MIISGVESKGKEGKGIHIQGEKSLIFLQECYRNTMLCLMDTLTMKDTVKQNEGQLKFSSKFCSLKCLAPEVRLKSLIWKSFRALLPLGNEMWLTVVYEPEPCCCHLLVRGKFKPQIVGGAGEGQTLHQRACVRAKERGCTVFTIIHLNRGRDEHNEDFCCLWKITM